MNRYAEGSCLDLHANKCEGRRLPSHLLPDERNTDDFHERLLTGATAAGFTSPRATAAGAPGTGATSAGAIGLDTATILGIALVWI